MPTTKGPILSLESQGTTIYKVVLHDGSKDVLLNANDRAQQILVETAFITSRHIEVEYEDQNIQKCKLVADSTKTPLSDEDIRKLHAENNQNYNQLFLITSDAITLFGVVTGWILPKDLTPSAPAMEASRFYVINLLYILLFILYLWSRLLGSLSNTLVTYLKIKKASVWEEDAAKYFDGFWRITPGKMHTIIFLALGVACCGLTVILTSFVFKSKVESPKIACITWITAIVYILAVIIIGFTRYFRSESRVRQNLENAIR
jgi:hypothetical protein